MGSLVTSLVVYASSAFCKIYSCETMSDSKHSTSDSSSEKRDGSSNSDGDDTGINFIFGSDFIPYQNEPLAANDSTSSDKRRG